MPCVEEDDHGRDDLRVAQVATVDARLHQAGHEIVPWRVAALGDELERVVAERRRCGIRGDRLLLGRVELVHLHHRVRPVEEVALAVARHAEPRADQADRVRLGEVVEQVHAPPARERLEELPRETRGRLAHRLDGARRERRRDELPDARVIGRLEPQQAPALDVPERAPAGVEGLRVELLVGSDMTVVAPEPAIAQACAHVGVASDEPAIELFVAEDGRRLAKLGEHRIRICEERGCGRIELHDLLARADVLEQAVHAERDESRCGHAQADHAEHATGRREAPSGTSAQRHPRSDARATSQRERDEPEPGGQRNRESRMQQVVRVAEAREKDGERQCGARRQTR